MFWTYELAEHSSPYANHITHRLAQCLCNRLQNLAPSPTQWHWVTLVATKKTVLFVCLSHAASLFCSSSHLLASLFLILRVSIFSLALGLFSYVMPVEDHLPTLLPIRHLQDFIYYTYTFYTGILEEQTLRLPVLDDSKPLAILHTTTWLVCSQGQVRAASVEGWYWWSRRVYGVVVGCPGMPSSFPSHLVTLYFLSLPPFCHISVT